MSKWAAVLALGTLMGLVACGGASPKNSTTLTTAGGQPIAVEFVRSEKAQLSPVVPEADRRELVAGNTVFALDLYREVFAREKNVLFSPHSLSVALAMTYAGAAGETERQMKEVLHFTLPTERLHAAFNALDRALASAERPASGKEQREVTLRLVNSLWGQRGYDFLAPFLDLLAENYGAGMRLVDFQHQPEPARQSINRWVAGETKDKINHLLPPGSIRDITRLVLVNAVYLHAPWALPFLKESTTPGDFRRLDGSIVQVPFMHQTKSLPYGETAEWQALELPYEGGRLSLVLLLPRVGDFEQFASGLEANELTRILATFKPQQVELTLPRFKVSSAVALKRALMSLGMTDAFGSADFSRMDGTKNLLISDVYHQAFMAVDEDGTEAAAATAVVMDLTAAPSTEVRRVKLDRPFFYLIRDRETGTVLFLGHLVDPTAE